MGVSISKGNSKMGSIQSVSLPSIITCVECECNKKCYARRIERLRPSVKAAYKNNYNILLSEPDTYWREVEAAIMLSRFFRFHVAGDIPNNVYFLRMVMVAERNTHCEILCFTKKYDIVNACISRGKTLPQNLHIVFSIWRGYKQNNPYSFPEAHVRHKDGSTTANADAKECGGNCVNCASTDDGCWKLAHGEQVVFNEH